MPAQKPATGGLGRTIARSSTASCGFCVPGLHGGICPSALAPGPPWPAVSTGGGSKDCGTGFWLRCSGRLTQSVKLSGRSITWTAPAFGHISTLPRQKGEGDQALGRSRGGFGTKIHLRVEGQGKPVAFVLTPGQQHEASVFEELMTQGEVRRFGRGHLRIKPQRVCGDKGYSRRRIRAYLRRRGIRCTIPRKTNERRTGPFNRALYRQRNLVERTINRLKQLRRIATRYEKKAENYLAMLQIGSLLLWL